MKTVSSGSAVSCNGTDVPSLKVRTLAGMASKTTTTNVPKRIAHAPSLQVESLLVQDNDLAGIERRKHSNSEFLKSTWTPCFLSFLLFRVLY